MANLELREVVQWSSERSLYPRKSCMKRHQRCQEIRIFSIIMFIIVLSLQLTLFKGIKQVSLTEISIKPGNIRELTTVDAGQVIEKLSPFHNLEPDAYLDPVSFIKTTTDNALMVDTN